MLVQDKGNERQRKIMAPTFFASQLKVFVPMFQDVASKVLYLPPHRRRFEGLYDDDPLLGDRSSFKDEFVKLDPSGQLLVNVTGWVSRTTLDVVG